MKTIVQNPDGSGNITLIGFRKLTTKDDRENVEGHLIIVLGPQGSDIWEIEDSLNDEDPDSDKIMAIGELVVFYTKIYGDRSKKFDFIIVKPEVSFQLGFEDD